MTTVIAFVGGMMVGGMFGLLMAAVLMASREDTMNHGFKINGNILEITIHDNIHIDKVLVNRQIFSQCQRVCESCKYQGKEGHEEPCNSCEVGNSNYVPSVGQEEHTEERTETHACDCISRQDAINAFEPDHPVDWYTTMIVDVLENLPSAEPRKKGHWVGIDDEPFEDWECDRCGYTVFANDVCPIEYNFCPSCGADMRQREDTDE